MFLCVYSYWLLFVDCYFFRWTSTSNSVQQLYLATQPWASCEDER